MASTREVEDKVKFCTIHKVWYVEGEQPCKACEEAKREARDEAF